MPEWQERIVHDTKPSIRAEHELRYAAAAPLVLGSTVWVDLGCGSGVAARAAIGDGFSGHAVLVDVADRAIEEARATIAAGAITALRADLADPADVARVRGAILAAGRGGCVTCFEAIEHMETFVPVLDLVRELAEDHAFTVMLSVPNDAFWALENPFHKTMWGEGAFEELRRLLPERHVVARQVPLTGSAVVRDDDAGAIDLAAVRVGAERVPSHFLAAFGPRAEELVERGHVSAADLDGQRTWERQRESQLAFHEAELAELRAYVHRLEARLGEHPPVAPIERV